MVEGAQRSVEAQPSAAVQEDITSTNQAFIPAAPPSSPVSTAPTIAATDHQNITSGITTVANVSADGNARHGRDFAFDNCRPCHVVAFDQKSPTRFSDAPDFMRIANNAATTNLSLAVWLTNPHPTMPSLVLSPQEAGDVIAYILSLRQPK